MKKLSLGKTVLKRLRSFAGVASAPGKVAPVTAGRLIGETILNILSEDVEPGGTAQE